MMNPNMLSINNSSVLVNKQYEMALIREEYTHPKFIKNPQFVKNSKFTKHPQFINNQELKTKVCKKLSKLQKILKNRSCNLLCLIFGI